jgi:hypothetical protein
MPLRYECFTSLEFSPPALLGFLGCPFFRAPFAENSRSLRVNLYLFLRHANSAFVTFSKRWNGETVLDGSDFATLRPKRAQPDIARPACRVSEEIQLRFSSAGSALPVNAL